MKNQTKPESDLEDVVFVALTDHSAVAIDARDARAYYAGYRLCSAFMLAVLLIVFLVALFLD